MLEPRLSKDDATPNPGDTHMDDIQKVILTHRSSNKEDRQTALLTKTSELLRKLAAKHGLTMFFFGCTKKLETVTEDDARQVRKAAGAFMIHEMSQEHAFIMGAQIVRNKRILKAVLLGVKAGLGQGALVLDEADFLSGSGSESEPGVDRDEEARDDFKKILAALNDSNTTIQ